MPEPDAWNIGSVLAAAMRCEQKNYIAQGQAAPLMALLFSKISAEEQQFIRSGFLEGGKREAVYSISRRDWFAVPLNSDACNALQYTLNQYKAVAPQR
jgi:hypothetical protein